MQDNEDELLQEEYDSTYIPEKESDINKNKSLRLEGHIKKRYMKGKFIHAFKEKRLRKFK